MKQKYIIFTVIISLMSSLIVPTMSVANSEQIFSDLPSTHWAHKFITKMNIREVVNGYTDNTFKPNQGINQLEAISMIVRFLGYEDEANSAKGLEVSEDNELYVYIQNVPDWAKGNVLVAARLGLISTASAAGFNPTEEATRAWLAKLLITAIQKHGTISVSSSGLSFNDSNSIPSWARDEVNLATSLNIITGYPDGTFKPERTVTRAEMTALLYKSEEYINSSYLKNVVKGSIEVKQDDALIINVGKNELIKVLLNDTAVIYQGDQRIDYSKLRTTDNVSIVTNNNNVILYLDLIDTSERRTNEIEGRVYLLDVNNQLLTLEDDNKTFLSYKLTSNTVVIKNNSQISIGQLNNYDKVKVLIEENEIKQIEVVDAYQQQKVAEIISLNSKEQVVTVKHTDNTFEVISVKNSVKLLDKQGGIITFEQLSTGEVVNINYHQDKVDSIQIPLNQVSDYTISKLSNRYVTVVRNGKTEEIDFDAAIKVSIKGYAEPSTSDLQIGDRIKVNIKNEKIVELEVLNRERKAYILDGKDTSASALRVKDIQTEQLSYISYDNNVKIYHNNASQTTLSNLYSTDRIYVNIQDGKVIRIDKAVAGTYELREKFPEYNLLKVRGMNNRTHDYFYSTETVIKINGSVGNIARIEVDDYINIYSVGNQILEISK